MPNVRSIRRTIKDLGIPADVASRIDFPQPQGNPPAEVLALIEQMDALLTPEQRIAVMQEQGCHKTGAANERNLAFARQHADRSVEERIELRDDSNIDPSVGCRINEDGTLTLYWEIGEPGAYVCVCACYRRLKRDQPQIGCISKTFCGCCGGHIRHHYQNILGVPLQLREIVSSPIASNGERRCEFLFDMVR